MKHVFVKISSRGKVTQRRFLCGPIGATGPTGPMGCIGVIGPIRNTSYNMIGPTGSIGPSKNFMKGPVGITGPTGPRGKT